MTLAPTMSECADNFNYRDIEVDIGCDSINGVVCHMLGFVGLSEEGVRGIMLHCPKSCGYCKRREIRPPLIIDLLEPGHSVTNKANSISSPNYFRSKWLAPTVSPTATPSVLTLNPTKFHTTQPTTNPTIGPTNIPTKWPTFSPSAFPSTFSPSAFPSTFSPSAFPSYAATPACADDPTYENFIGMGCRFYSGSNCMILDRIGLSWVDVIDAIRRCPRSCGFCKQETNPSVPTSSPTVECTDNETFAFKYGLTCYHYGKLGDCGQLGKVGFSPADVYLVVSNCRKSCNKC